ncbi:uncharacterized protein Tco025E_04699 [Trypanosoma conorhini]|uniref:Ras-GEF domain-containing protein n=1 Tax=Trypanosoma conorhini TaxID=83891 RepID=A0A3S5ITI4_9TRYP|nr:uncharacterized protein Tco025E_04699 [Trypanosoma conorhini]RNF17968.1 hypothetical protein Tco025E_04699 [Trypanosoma conorhini]
MLQCAPPPFSAVPPLPRCHFPASGRPLAVGVLAPMQRSPVADGRFVVCSPTQWEALSSPLSPPPPPSSSSSSTESDGKGAPASPVAGAPRPLEGVVRRPVRRPGTTSCPATAEVRGSGGVWPSAATPPLSPGSTEGRGALTPGKSPTPASPPSGSDAEASWASTLFARYPYYNSNTPFPLTVVDAQQKLRRRHRDPGAAASPTIPQTAANCSRDAAPPPLTVLDMNQAIQRSMEEYERATSRLTSSISFTHVHKGKGVGEADTTGPSARLFDCLRELRLESDVNGFVAAFFSANGYGEAQRSFRMHLPLAEQQLQSCLYHYHRKQQQQQQQERQRRYLAPTPSAQQERPEALSSPTYAMTSDDLLLLVMETVRRRQLLNDSLPWREVNCRRRDYRLEPLMRQPRSQEHTPTQRDSDSAASCGSAVGGSLDLLIEVLILAETDVPFTMGMPLMNYTNTFIVLASLFVTPEVLLVRLIRLFRHVQQEVLLDDSRRVFLQRRIVQFMTAYCIYHEADVTYALLERLRRFLRGLRVTPPLGHSSRNAHPADWDAALPPATATQQILEGFPVVNAEVAPRLNELSAFVERTVEETCMGPNEGSQNVCCQPRLTAPVKPLGTLLPASTQQAGGAQAEDGVGAALHEACLKRDRHQTALAFTALGAEILAMQLCLLSFKLFADIRLRELLNNAWCDETMRMSVPTYLSRLIDYSSHVQRWATAVIVSPARWSECQKAMRQAIRLCRWLYDQQNYEMASAVLGGLQHPAVAALEELYQRRVEPHGMLGDEERREFAALQNLMDPFASQASPSSFSCISSRAPEESQAPMIPLLAPLLGVLFRSEEAKGQTVELSPTTGVPIVNWSKVMAIGSTVFLWLRCQNTPYAYAPDDTLQHYLWQLPGHELHDATLMRIARRKRLP